MLVVGLVSEVGERCIGEAGLSLPLPGFPKSEGKVGDAEPLLLSCVQSVYSVSGVGCCSPVVVQMGLSLVAVVQSLAVVLAVVVHS